ncbi:hypothetical protein Dimus_000469 [Dionaea muscipula]
MESKLRLHEQRHPHALLQDLIFFEEILPRLEVKCLLRLKTVCKEWCSIISSPQFAKSHLLRATTKSSSTAAADRRYFIFDPDDRRRPDGRPYVATGCPRTRGCRWDEGLRKLKGLVVTKGRLREFSVIGSSNGLIFIGSRPKNSLRAYCKFYICNPTLDVSLGLPMPKFVPRTLSYILCGFGYMPSLDDYRAALIPFSSEYKSMPLAYMFSLASGRWDEVELSNEITIGFIHSEKFWNGVPFNNKFHWLLKRPPTDKSQPHGECTIGYFSVVNGDDDEQQQQQQMIKEIPLPTAVQQLAEEHAAVVIGVLGGCLCAAVGWVYDRSLQVWSLKQYGVPDSWTKVTEIDLISILGGAPTRLITHYKSIVDGVLHVNVVAVTGYINYDRSVMLIDLNSSPPICVFYDHSWNCRYIIGYMESLVLHPERGLRRLKRLGGKSQQKRTTKRKR